MIKAGIIGATGYAGNEIVRLLLGHKDVEVAWYGSRSYIDQKYADVYQNFFKLVDAKCMDDNMEALADEVDVIFTATPQGLCASLINEGILSKAKVIDLSADFRIKDVKKYEKWYGIEHKAPQFIDEAVYGLCEITGPGVAMDCIHHAGLHVNADHFYPEVLNPATNEACADGETGELVFTTLSKEAMPLLRYRTKDLTSIDHSRCACGRTTPRISKFTGRTDDMKVIRGVNVFPTQVETALLSMGGAVAPHYMMIVDREDNLDVLTVMVEVDESMFSDEIRKLDALRDKIAAVLKTALGVSVRVKLVEPKSIQRSEGKAVRVIDNRNL